jgi:transposase
MAAKLIKMSTIKQIIRFNSQGKGIKFIARGCGISKNTVKRYLHIFNQCGHSNDELLLLDDVILEGILLQKEKPVKDDVYTLLMSLMPYFETELQKTGVTKLLLWQEYKAKLTTAYSYTQFCYYLGLYLKSKKTSMVVEHQIGNLLYVDFAGKTMSYYDKNTGEEIKAQVFMATLGYSQYAFVQAVNSQKIPDFIDALNGCVRYLGGVPLAIVPDNLKSAVIKADRYEPDINRVLEDWANHNSTTIIPARALKPKDKSLVEGLVKISYSRIYAPLRNCIFTDLPSLNSAILKQLKIHNEEKFQRKTYSRSDVFFGEEKATLKPLPQEEFKVKKYKTYTVQKNCHIALSEDNHYYSVPKAYVGQKVEVIYTKNMVSIYYQHKLVAQHLRAYSQHGYTSIASHLPSNYGFYKDRSPDYYRNASLQYNTDFQLIISHVLSKKLHPEQAYKSCDGLFSLARKTEKLLFEKACRLASLADDYSYRFIRLVLTNGTAAHFEEHIEEPTQPIPTHKNIRGKQYYNQINNTNQK